MRGLLTTLLLTTWLLCSGQWWDGDWDYRVAITADADSSVTDADFLYTFPLSDMPAGFWTNTQTDGDDIRVTNWDGDQVPFYVEQFDDTGEKGTLYFLAGASATVDSLFYVYYGNSGAAGLAVGDTYGQYNTFQNYDYYYPMTGAEDGAGEVVYNKVTNDSHLDPQGTKTGDAVTGQLDHDAYDIDGKMYWVNPTGAGADDPARGVNDAAHFGRGLAFPFTINVWIAPSLAHEAVYNHSSFTNGMTSTIAGQYYSSTGHRCWNFWYDVRNQGDPSLRPAQIGFSKYNSSNAGASILSGGLPGDTLPTNGDYVMVTIAADAAATDIDFFYNGVKMNNGAFADNSIRTSTSSANYPFVGAVARSSKNPDAVMFGAIQDVSFSGEKLADGYIAATYSMQRTPETFWDVGAEDNGAGGARRRIMIGGFIMPGWGIVLIAAVAVTGLMHLLLEDCE